MHSRTNRISQNHAWSSLGLPDPESPAGRHFDWHELNVPSPNSPAGKQFDYSTHRDSGNRGLDALMGLPDWRQSTSIAVHHARHSHRLATIDELISTIQHEFPNASIRVTGRGRTVERQAELMAQRRRQNRAQFLHTYRPAHHITEMDQWVTTHPNASEDETTAAFREIIDHARQNGAVVSNHLSDHARDISIPQGGQLVQRRVRHRLRQLGAHVIDEHDAVGGPHWHVDF